MFADELGPRARRRVQIVSAIAFVAVAAIVALAVRRFAAEGQLAPELWTVLFIPEVLRFLALGLLVTLRAALTAGFFALLIGGLLALGRLARSAPIRWAAGAYVEFFRALPLLTLLIFAAFGLPKLGLDYSRLTYVIIALAVYNSAVLGEIFRAGILSLERGQSEAAYAVGLTYWQAMLLVIVPQALRRMVPAVVSQLVTLIKDTSLGAIIGLEEFLRRGQLEGEFDRNPLQALLFVALVYILLCYALSRLARRLEQRQRRRYSAGAIQVAGAGEDLAVNEELART